MENLIGNRYNRFIVIGKDDKKYYWICKCDCGTVKSVRSDHLKSGATKSCGCKTRENASKLGKRTSDKISGWNFEDITGKRFGRLTVKGLYEKGNNKKSPLWLCKCDCGAETIVAGTNIRIGHTTSCGCATSQWEEKIGRILTANGLHFTKNKTFNTCRFENGTLAKFDFYVESEFIVEFDGEQHEKPVKLWGGVDEYEKMKHRDNIKNEWCINNKIPLVRIPYSARKNLNINDIMPKSSKYLLKA